MSLFKLIIVDDERETREGLMEDIDWSKLGVQVLGQAKDGLQALKLVKEVQPDIILTDVRMPHMNGIEFASEVLKALPGTKIIFMSGYSDKEYLKSAIKLNAIDYVEKPINLEEVAEAVKKAALISLKERNMLAKAEEIKNNHEKNMALVRQELALKLMHRVNDLNALKKEFNIKRMSIPADGNFRTVFMKFNAHKIKQSEEQIAVLHSRLIEMTEQKFIESSCGFFGCSVDMEHWIYHIYGRLAENDVSLRELLKGLQKQMNAAGSFEGTVTMGVGRMVRGLENIPDSYQKARKSLQEHFVAGYNSILFYQGESKACNTIESSNIILSHLKHGDFEEAEECLQRLFDEISHKRDINVTQVKSLLLAVLLQISMAAKEKGLELENEFNENELMWAEIVNKFTLEEVKKFIYERLKLIIDRLCERGGKSKKILAAMQYIREHYNEDVSVNNIADHVLLAPTYLCQIFKKETGMTVKEYVEEVRVAKAKELLKDTEMKLTEVAQRVGYFKASYFSDIFKKVTGMYPSEYRKKG